MHRRHLIGLFLWLLAAAPCVLAQQATGEKIALATYLKGLEDSSGLLFNYDPELLARLEIAPAAAMGDAESLLAYLREQTGLRFTLLEGNIVAVESGQLRLCGYVLNKDTSEPLVGATVQAGSLAVITDLDGYFQMEVPTGRLPVRIRHVGYRSLAREVRFFDLENCGPVYLIAEQVLLPEVVVSEFMIRGIDKLDDGSYRIDFRTFSLLPGLVDKDVLQSLQALPGILSANETVSNLNIRGGTHDQNLILWDEIKMYQSGHFFGLISLYNPQITQRVLLRKNGTPPPYAGGVSGTIDMQTETEVNRDFQASLGLNFIDASVFADLPTGDRSSLQVAARKAINELVETPTYTSYFDRISQDTEISQNAANTATSDIGFDFYDFSFRWLYTPGNKDLIRLNLITAFNDLTFNENAPLNQQSVSRESNLRQFSIGAGLHHRRQWSEDLSSELTVYNTDYQLRSVNANIQLDQRFLQENKVSETGARLGLSHRLARWLQLWGGYQFTETKITNLDDVDNPIFRNLEGNVLRSHALFGTAGLLSASGQTAFKLGLRATYLDKFGRYLWEPRMSFNQRFLKHFNLEILGEFNHQTTSQVINFQDDFLGLEKRRWQLADNDSIPVIESRQGSVGISFARSGWLVSGELFYKEVDGVTTQSQGFQDAYQFERSAGRYDAYGADFLLKKRFDRLETWLSYANLNSRYYFEQLPEPEFDSNLAITHTITAGATLSARNFLISAGFNWHSGRPYTQPVPLQDPTAGTIQYGPANAHRLPDYLRLDASALYEIRLGGQTAMDLGLSVWNLLDRPNAINRFYRPGSQGQLETRTQYSLGMTPNVLVRMRLN